MLGVGKIFLSSSPESEPLRPDRRTSANKKNKVRTVAFIKAFIFLSESVVNGQKVLGSLRLTVEEEEDKWHAIDRRGVFPSLI